MRARKRSAAGLPKSGSASLIERHPRATLAFAVLIGLIVPVVLRSLPPPRVAVGHTPVLEAVIADRGSPSAGPASAPVTVAIFTDYQCPICRADERAVESVRREKVAVRFIYKDWPIFGERSRYAARVALAANFQGRYLAVHTALMRTHEPLNPEGVRNAAVAAGANWLQIQADLVAHGAEIDAQLKRHAAEAWSLGLQGTPAYIVGTDLYQGRISERGLLGAIAHAGG